MFQLVADRERGSECLSPPPHGRATDTIENWFGAKLRTEQCRRWSQD